MGLRSAAATLALALALVGCGSGTTTLTSSAPSLWATDTATLTCTLTAPAGTPPAIAQFCDLDVAPAAAGTAGTPITVPAGAGSATSTFTAAPVTEDTLATITAYWRQAYTTDPFGTASITVHPPRGTGGAAGVSVVIEPSVSRSPAGLLRYTFVITTQTVAPPAPADELVRIVATFVAPGTVGPGTACVNTTIGVVGTTSQPAGQAMQFTVNCNVPSARMTAVFDFDRSPAPTGTSITVVLANGSTVVIPLVGPTP